MPPRSSRYAPRQNSRAQKLLPAGHAFLTASGPHTTDTLASAAPADGRRALTEHDAINIWIARWIRVQPKELVRRYACDPRRLYEIWEEVRFPGSRKKALDLFRARYPGLDSRIDPGPHRRMSSKPGPDQLSLFAEP